MEAVVEAVTEAVRPTSSPLVILLDWRGVNLRPNLRHPLKRRFAARIVTAL